MVYEQSLEDTTAQAMKSLRTIYGPSVPDPIGVTIPDWWVNPLFHGTYSNIPPGFGDKQMTDFQAAAGRLYFGERLLVMHTVAMYMGDTSLA